MRMNTLQNELLDGVLICLGNVHGGSSRRCRFCCIFMVEECNNTVHTGLSQHFTNETTFCENVNAFDIAYWSKDVCRYDNLLVVSIKRVDANAWL